MDRARRFYEENVGLTRIEEEVHGTIGYGCGGGTALALFERPTEPLDRTVAAWEVEDIRVKRAFFGDPDAQLDLGLTGTIGNAASADHPPILHHFHPPRVGDPASTTSEISAALSQSAQAITRAPSEQTAT